MEKKRRDLVLSKDVLAAIWVGTAVIWGANAYKLHQDANQAEAQISQLQEQDQVTRAQGLTIDHDTEIAQLAYYASDSREDGNIYLGVALVNTFIAGLAIKRAFEENQPQEPQAPSMQYH